jgi:ketopantoate reductase
VGRGKCAAEWPRSKVSMLQDVEAGRELEVAALVTVVVDVARDLGIDTPRLDTLAALIDLRNENLRERMSEKSKLE